MNLTDEEIRIKVAKAMGWTHVQPIRHYGIKIVGVPPNARESDLNFPTPDPDIWCATVPNYPEDLNACAEFEAKLSNTEFRRYRRHLNKLCNPLNGSIPPTRELIFATARQRCLAYLKTKGLIP